MTTITLHHGDNRVTLRRLIDQGVRVHSVVTDAPYGLVSISKRFGGDKAAPAKFGTDGAFARASAGFMGSKWDGTGIERDPEFWRLIWEILLPGGYCIAFSGARTGHWQACAMETAGFIMHPMLGWLFGQGFPKAHNAAKAIDKKLGHQGGLVPIGDAVKRMIPGAQQNATGDWEKTDGREYQPGVYVPATEEARQWEGWAYGAQSMKPALEPIYVGQKPFSEKDGVLNLLKHGVGAMNIDGCRVPISDVADASQMRHMQRGDRSSDDGWGMGATADATVVSPKGRHPANLIHDGSAEVVALFPDSAGQIAKASSSSSRKNQNVYGDMRRGNDNPSEPRNDSGSAARFFNEFGYSDVEQIMRLTGCTDAEGHELVAYLEQHQPVSKAQPTFYHPKATKADRAGSKHPTVKPVALMRWLCRLVTPPGGTVLDPFAGSGTTAEAARAEGFDCMLMEAEDQFASDIRTRFNLPFPTPADSAMRTNAERLDGDDFADLYERDTAVAGLENDSEDDDFELLRA